MYLCMYWMYVCICTHAYIYIYIYICICMYVYTAPCMHTTHVRIGIAPFWAIPAMCRIPWLCLLCIPLYATTCEAHAEGAQSWGW